MLVVVLGLAMLAGPAQAAVPPATGNNAVITVKVGDARTGLSAVGNLAGVVLGFYTAATGGTLAFSCTSDADGDCSVTVPNTEVGGANRDRDLWIRQVSAPTGWFMNQAVGVGTTVGGTTPYTITGPEQLRNGQTYTSFVDFMIGTGSTNNAASSGIWQNSRTNPVVPQQCGIDVALLLDLSNSVTDAQLLQLKAAARTFVNSLVGTPSRIAIFTFATNAPATAGDTLTLTPVSTQAAADTVNTRIDALAKPGGNAGGTNWDRGVFQIAQSPSVFDEAIIITDGNPTFYGNGDGPGNRTRFRELENGIFSANAVKAEGTRVVAVGVGDGVGSAGSGANLRSLSGTTLNSDYFQTEDYAEAGEQLRTLALGACQGSITVVKQVIPPGGTVAQAQPAGGWDFTGQGTAGAVTVDAPTTRTTAAGTGAANFPLTFPGGSTSGDVTMTETPQAGYTLEPVNGSNATCINLNTGDPVVSTNVTNGFTVAANLNYPVSCQVYNRSPLEPASVVLTKTWTIDGTDYLHDLRPPGFEAEALLDGTTQPWDVPAPGFFQGDVVEIDEGEVQLPTLCTLDSQQLTLANGDTVALPLPSDQTLNPGLNTYRITNVVTCDTQLTLVKDVTNGTAEPDEWTLDAVAPGGALAGPSGTTGVTASVTPDVTYPLAESDGDPNYVQDVDPNAVLIPGSTGSWSCIPLDADGNPAGQPFDGLNGGVTVPLGSWAQCTASNATATLELVKEVENTSGGTAVPGDWDLTATPLDPPDGVETQTVNGADSVIFNVRPGVTYELSESDGPAGYLNTTVICDFDLERTLIEEVTLEAGDTARCVFTNVDSPATLTLVKDVVNDNGGTALPGDWTLSADGPTPVSGAGNSDEVTDRTVSAGSYDLSEADGPAGYTAADWACEGGTLTGATVTIPNGGDVTCTIVNDDQPAQLTLVKEVVNDNGGTALPGDWTLSADGPTPVSGAGNSDDVTDQTVSAGDYDLSEADGPTGYTAADWACEGATLTGATVTIANGGDATCTIVNDDQPAQLTLVKEVVNDNGGTALPGDWTLSADGPTPVSGAGNSDDVTDQSVSAGDYDLSEADGPTGYTAGAWDCGEAELAGSTVTIALGDDVTCTIVNDDQPAQLTLVKEVVNDNGGTALPGDWTLSADGPTPVSGAGNSDDVTDQSVSAGDYDLSEADGPSGYTAGDWTCEGGTLQGTTLTLGLGDEATCTIVNDDQPAQLTLVKEVVNDNGGTAAPGDWTLSADGPTPISGAGNSDEVTDQPVSAGDYDLSEADGPTGYAAGDWTCDGGTLDGTTVTVSNGAEVTCTIVNNDQPAQLTLVKEVVNDNGGTAAPGDWTLSADGPTPISGAGNSDEVTDQPVSAGDYDLSEADGPTGYAAGDWTCDGGTLDGTTLTLALGENVTCTIVNNDLAGRWTVEKASDPVSGSTVQPGDLITYTVTATKLDGSDLTDLVVRDDLSEVLNNATLVPGSIETSTGTASVSGTTLSWDIPLLSDSETVTYQVRVNDDAWAVQLTNVVTGDGAEPCVPGDGTTTPLLAAAAEDEECDSTHHYTPAWTLAKSSDPVSGSEVEGGDVIAYTLTAENISNAVLEDAVVEDDLSEVLAHAELLGVPDGAELDGTTLIWSVPTLQPGESATLTYEVRVDSDAEDVTLVNVAVPGPGGDCVTSCSTDHDVPPGPAAPVPTLPGTGVTVFWTVLLGLLLTGGGAALVVVRRRYTRA